MSRLTCLIGTLLLMLPVAQAQEPVPNTGNQRSDSPTAEEKMIRAAYAKLEVYNRAAELMEMNGVASKVRDDSVLKFELKNFQTGPIDAIKKLRVSELCTPHSGDVVDVSSGQHTLNGGPPEALYSARWTREPPERPGRDWIVGDLLQLLVDEYFDVGQYTSYDVVVSLEGKSRSYKAIVLHHNLGARSVEPIPTFWDSIGAGNRLTQVWHEKLPPFGTGQSKILISPN